MTDPAVVPFGIFAVAGGVIGYFWFDFELTAWTVLVAGAVLFGAAWLFGVHPPVRISHFTLEAILEGLAEPGLTAWAAYLGSMVAGLVLGILMGRFLLRRSAG